MIEHEPDAFSASQDQQIVVIDSGRAQIPDQSAMFRGTFVRDGHDLVITTNDTESIRVVDFFEQTTPPDLIAPNGAVLRGEHAARLAGVVEDTRQSFFHDQGGTPDGTPAPIGRVDSTEGPVTATRSDGSIDVLDEGDFVFQNDVVATGFDGSVSITFIDGTVFALSAFSTMVLDELIYDPDGGDNSAVFSLIQGGFVFIAGQVAPTGDMQIETPAGVLGVRGTTVEVQILTNEGVVEVLVQLLLDEDGGRGAIEIRDLNGDLVAVVIDTEIAWILSPEEGQTREIPRSEAEPLSDPGLRDLAIRTLRGQAGRDEEDGDEEESGGGNPTDGAQEDGEEGDPDDTLDTAPGDGDGGEAPVPGGVPEDEPEEDVAPDEEIEEGAAPAPSQPVQETGLQPVPAEVQTAEASAADAVEGPEESLAQIDAPTGAIGPGTPAPTTPLLTEAVSFAANEVVSTDEASVFGDVSAALDAADDSDLGLDPGLGDTSVAAAPDSLPLGTLALATFEAPAAADDSTVSDVGLNEVDGFPDPAVNDPPVAVADTASTTEDTPVTIDVLANDSDPDGPAPSVASVTQGTNGSVVIEADGQVTYTPEADFSGTDTFTYDLAGGGTATVTVDVTAVNDPPVAVADTASTTEDTPVTIDVLANDSDPDGPAPSVASVTQGTNGSVVIEADGQVTYTPEADFSGTDTFTYDLAGGGTATVTVDVTAVNDPPVAVADTASTTEDTPVTIDVLANDSDPDGPAPSVASVTQGTNGSVVIEADGQVTYTPEADFSGTDTFTYDLAGGGTATVTVDVTAVNDPPVAVADTASTTEDTPVTIDVLANDSDPDGPAPSVASVTQGTNGSVVIEADGQVTYTPEADFSGTDTFTYDLAGGGTATVTVDVTAVNDPPVAVADTASTTEDTPVTIDVLANDSDPDGPAPSVASVTQGTNGSVVIEADGQVTYTPEADFSGTDTFTYDLAGGGTATVTVDVTAVNDPPVAVADTASTTEDTPVTIDVLANDSDPDGPAPSVASVTQGTNGSVVIEADGQVTYTPEADFSGTDTFTYDLAGGGTATVTVDVTAVNDPPVAVADTASTTEDTPVTIDVLANDSDPDGPAPSVASVTQGTNGSVVIEADGQVTYTPEADFSGTDTFTYDLAGGGTATVTVDVTAVNDPPVAVADTASTTEDTPVTIDVLANDSDPDGPAPSVASVTQGTNGSVVIEADGQVTYTPEADFSGTDTFTYDLAGGGTATVTVDVTAVNDPPVAVADTASTTEDTPVTIDVLANDSDPDGPAPSVASVTQGTNGSVVIEADGQVTYTPEADFSGTDTFTYDLAGGGTATVTVDVTAVNDPPVAVADTASTTEDTPVTIDVLANDSDPDGPAPSVASVTQGTNGSVVIEADGQVTYTPEADFSGTDTFTYDLAGGGTATVTVDVTAVNDPPVAVADTASTTEDTPVTIDVLANDSDPDGPAPSVASVTQGTNGSVVIEADGQVTYTPEADFSGTDTFTYDLAGGGTATVTVDVTAVNDPPVAVADTASTTEDTPVTIDVLANDSDPDGPAPSVASVTQGTNGSVVIEADGQVTYTPEADFSGTDTFTYDLAGGGTATVTVDVTAVNDPPVAVADTASTTEDTPVTIDVLANDSDPDGPAPSVASVTQGTNGSVVIEADGQVTYTPEADFSGTDTFTYDLAGGGTATVTVDVTAVNDPPVAVADTASTTEDTPVTIDVLANDSDPDGPAPSVASVTQGTNGSVVIEADGQVTYTPEADFSGTDTFTYDLAGGGTATVTVDVTAVNDPPVAVADTASTTEDTPVTIDVLANDSDPDGPAPSVASVTQGTNGSVVIEADGQVTYTPEADFSGTDTFTYDLAGGGTATVTVDVTAVNDPPVAVADTASTTEDTPVTIDVLANDSDPDGPAPSVASVTQGTNGSVVIEADGQVTYTPEADFSGTDTFTYDLAGGGTATVTVDVTAVNDPPVAVADTASTTEDTPVTIDVLANDSDPDGPAPSVASVTQGTNGSVVIEADGQVTYTPEADFSGTDTFTYDLAGGGTATVTVDVTAVNDPPVAVADTASTTEDTPVTIDVLANDSDPDGPAPSVASVTQGTNGSVVIEADGQVTYTPEADFSGTDTFTYDLAGGGTATVTVDVTAVNDPPVAVADTASTTEDTPVTIDVLANDSDPDGPAPSVASVTQGTNGSVVIEADGQVTYTPEADFSGTDTFTYDLAGGGTATVTVDVTAVNDPPVAVADTASTTEDTPVTIDVLANDSDPDGPAPSVASVTQGTNGSVVIEADGQVTYTPEADFSGTDTFTYDLAGGGTATVTVDVTAVNDPPVAVADTASTTEDTPVTIDVLANDSDPDGPAPSVASVTQGTNGSVVIEADGQVTYTPEADFSGTDTFTYDLAGGGTATVTVDVTAVNDPPVAVADTASTTEDTPVTIDVLANDSDPDGPAPSVASVTQGTNGSVVIEADGQVTYTPEADFSGTDTFTYDLAGGGTATVTVDVTAVNDPPVAVADTASTTEDTPVTIDVLANDSDPDGPAPSVASVTQGTNGSVVIEADGQVTYTPEADFSGTDTFTYDLAGGGTATVTVDVTAVNDPPVAVADTASTTEDTPVTIDVLANDSDPDGPAPSVASVTQGTNGSVVIEADGQVTYTPEADFSGTDTFTYDLAGGGTATVTVDVTAVNDPPVAVADTASTTEDTPVTIDVLANDSDPDGPAPSVASVTQGTNGSVVIEADGQVTYTPEADFSGTDTFTYDLAGGGTATVTVDVTAVNDPPVAVADTASTTEDTPVTIDVLANDSDPDGPAPSVASVTQGTNGSVVIEADGQVTYTPEADFSGTDTFTYDLAGGGTATVTVDVTAVNDPPVAVADTASTTEDTPVTIDVLANDSDPDGPAPSVASVTQGTNGSVVIEADGQVTYTPEADFSGTDTFTYDLAGGGTATVTVDVTAVNDPPVAVADTASTTEDTPVTIDVLANDSDPDGPAPSVASVTQGTNGSVVIEADGQVTYTPEADFSGTDTFTYDLAGGGTATVTVDVTAVNDPPVAVADTASTTEDTPVTIDVLANDSDPDGPAPSVASVTQGTNGSVVIEADGQVTYTPEADFSGTDTFTYDLAGGGTATVTVDVTAVNDPPVAVADTASTTEDTPVTIDVLANDSDPDGPAPSVASVTQGTNGSVVIEADGQVTYTPEADFSGTDTFTYDLAGGGTATVTVDVTAVNDPPVAVDDAVTLSEDSPPILIQPTGNDNDPENGPLTITGFTTAANGLVQLNSDTALLYTPDEDFNGNDSFTYTIRDAEGLTSTATVNLTVTPVSDPVSIDPVTGDDRLDVEEQLNPVVITGTAESNGTVLVSFGGIEQTVVSGVDGSFEVTFSPAAIPDAPSVSVTATATDEFGNTGATASIAVDIDQPGNVVTITTAGSVSNFANPLFPVGLNISEMPYDAIFDEIDAGVFAERPPSVNSATEVRWQADDLRTFAFTGTDLNFNAGTGIVTGIEIGTPGDTDYYAVAGIEKPMSEIKQIIADTLVGNSIDEGPFDAFFGEYRLVFNGSAGDDQLSFENFSQFGDQYFGNGGNDEFRGGAGDDEYFGGIGDDTFVDWEGNNSFDGGADVDFVSYAFAPDAVTVNLNTNSASKTDGTNDTLINIEGIRGSAFDDDITLDNSAEVNIVQGLAGRDTLRGGTSSVDILDYTRDSRFTANTNGVVVSLATGVAIDLFGDVDSISGFEVVFGTEFGDEITAAGDEAQLFGFDGADLLISGAGNDFFSLGAGADTLRFTAGTDIADDFNASEDMLEFDGDALTFIDSLVLTDLGGTAVSFDFTDDSATAFSLTLSGVTLAEAEQILDDMGLGGGEVIVNPEDTDVSGSPGDDIFTVAAGGENINRTFQASGGIDTYDFTNSSFTNYNQIDYSGLGLASISANLDLTSAVSQVNKGAATDELINVATSAAWGFGIIGTAGNDTFTVTQSGDFSFVLLDVGGGDDTVTLNAAGDGFLRLNFGRDADVTADIGAATFNATNGDSITLIRNGDTSETRYEIATGSGDDDVTGSANRDRFILGPGTDSADGLGDYDIVRYDRLEITTGVTVDLGSGINGTATGVWDGLVFNHTLSNIEEVRGSAANDSLTAADTGSELFGNDGDDRLVGSLGADNLNGGDGNDELYGEDGRDFLRGNDGDDLLDASGGAAGTQGVGDNIRPGLGTNTILGHEALFLEGESADLSYADIEDASGVTIRVDGSLGVAGSGTVSGVGGQIDDTFTFIRYFEGSQGNDTFFGSNTASYESFAPLGGVDTIFGGTTELEVVYNYETDFFDGVGVGIIANLFDGTIVDTQGNTDIVNNIYSVRGSEFGDVLDATGMTTDVRFRGEGGNDFLFGGDGRDLLFGGAGNDTIDASAGAAATQRFGDFINPGFGEDTVIGSLALWQSGEGLDYGYDNLGGTGGLTFTIGSDGSGSVTGSGPGGVINDTFTYTNFFSGSDDADIFDASLSNATFFLGFAGGGGADQFIGGTGTDDEVSYSFEDNFFGNTGDGIDADFGAGTIRDTQGFIDTITNIERVRGSQFDDRIDGSGATFGIRVRGEAGNDLIIDSAFDDRFDLDSGNDTLRYSAGNDYVDDFNKDEDTLEFAGGVLDNFGSLGFFEFNDQTGTFLEFRVPGSDDTGLGLGSGVTIEDAYDILAPTFATFSGVTITGDVGQEDIFGSPGDDTITITAPEFENRDIFISAGNDAYDFNVTGEFYTNFDYERIGSIGINALIDLLPGETSFVTKGNNLNGSDLTALAGADQIFDIRSATEEGGAQISTTRGDDEIEVRFNDDGDRDFFSIDNNGGTDTVTVTEFGRGTLQLQLGRDGDVFADMAANDIRAPDRFGPDNTRFIVDFGGTDLDAVNLRYDIRTRDGNDTVFGTDTTNRFTLEAGENFVDGRGGTDTIRYNSGSYTSGIIVDLRPLDPTDASITTQVTGTYRDNPFTDTIVNIESVDGSQQDDEIYGSVVGGRLDGRGGNDLIVSGDGIDELFGGSGDDVLITDAGLSDDIIAGGSGRDTILFDTSTDGNIDLSVLSLAGKTSGIEVLSLEGATSGDQLTLSLQNIFDLAPDFDAVLDSAINSDPVLAATFGGVGTRMTVIGDAGDQLILSERADFSATPEGQVSDGKGRTLNIYAYDAGGGAGIEAIVAVEDAVEVAV